MPSEELFTSEYFQSLYTATSWESVIWLDDAPWITIIKPYPDNQNDKRGFSMFIRFYLLDWFIHGSVNMVQDSTKYVIENKDQFSETFTNFYFNASDNIMFDSVTQKFVVPWKISWKKEISVNEFVDKLVKNHLSEKSKWLKLKDMISHIFNLSILSITFWLLDSRYNWSYYILNFQKRVLKSNIGRNEVYYVDIPKPEDPFFKYFRLHKRLSLIVIFLVTCFLVIGFNEYISCWGFQNKWMRLFDSWYFTITNPLLFFVFFLILLIVEIIWDFLRNTCNQEEKWFIRKMHNSLYQNSFNLKF